MSKLNTVDVPSRGEGGNNLPKSLKPGNAKCVIHTVSMRQVPYKAGALEIILNLEGPAIGGDFEGFWIDKNDQSKGHFKGQVGGVKATEWAFADSQTKSGIPIKRDMEIMKFMKELCDALGISKWMADQNEKHETIESLIEAFAKERPFQGIAMEYCIGGKEYQKGNYTNYDLFLPKPSKNGAPFNMDPDKVAKFNPEDHIRKKKVEPVSEFGSESTELSEGTAADFNLD